MARSLSRSIVAGAVFLLVVAGLGAATWWSIRGLMQAPTADSIPLTREQVTEAIEAVQSASLPQAPMPPATLVSLKLDNKPVREAIEALARASGVEIRPAYSGVWDEVRDKRVTVTLDQKPFWEAMAQICRQGGIWPTSETTSSRSSARPEPVTVRLDTSRRGKCPSLVCGPFLITANQIQHVIEREAAPPSQALHRVRMELFLLAEPKAALGASGVRAVVEEAVDERGHSLLVSSSPMAAPLPPTGATGIGWLQVFLSYPQNAGKRIARLKGYVALRAEKTQAVTVSDLSKPGEMIRMADGCGVQFIQINTDSGRPAVEIEITNLPTQHLYQRFPRASTLVQVLDSRGNPLPGRGYNSSSGLNGHRLKVYFDPANGSAARVVLNVPMETSEVRVPFEFADLPLP